MGSLRGQGNEAGKCRHRGVGTGYPSRTYKKAKGHARIQQRDAETLYGTSLGANVKERAHLPVADFAWA